MKNKKSQVQMGESIAVLFIFLILLGLGSIFMVNVFQGSVEKTYEEDLQLKAIDIAQRISFLPELQCSEEDITVEPCIDMFKLSATAEITSLNLIDYYPIFGYSAVVVEQIFPEPASDSGEWELYNREPEGWTSKKTIQLPTTLYDPAERAYDFGWVLVTVYS